jgi:hypothetical protein
MSDTPKALRYARLLDSAETRIGTVLTATLHLLNR